MQGRLGTEEWRPLLASSLIFYGQIQSRVNRRAALAFAPMLVLTAVLLLGLLIRTSIFNELSAVFILTALIIATAVAGAYTSLLLSRKSMLQADAKTAELTGPQSLLDALRKIQSLEQIDLQQDNMSAWAWTDYGDAPSIEKRIRNLQGFSQGKTLNSGLRS
jgi:Zn-dependent protease with chaperone function